MEEQRDRPEADLSAHIDPTKPAGNAQYDPREQTQRLDMPAAAQTSEGEPGRGTAPSRAADRSHQPHAHESTVQPFTSLSARATGVGRETLPKRNSLSKVRGKRGRVPTFVWPSLAALAAAVALNASGRRLLAACVAPAAPALFLWGLYRSSVRGHAGPTSRPAATS